MRDRKQEKKISRSQTMEMWRWAENDGTHFEWALHRSQPTPVRWARQLGRSSLSTWRTTVVSEKDNIKVCICLSHPAIVYFSLSKAVDSVYTLFCLSSVTVKKGSSEWTFVSMNQQCGVFVTFSYSKVTTGVRLHVRCRVTLIDYLEQWCYVCLCGAVALQMSDENRGATLTAKSILILFHEQVVEGIQNRKRLT